MAMPNSAATGCAAVKGRCHSHHTICDDVCHDHGGAFHPNSPMALRTSTSAACQRPLSFTLTSLPTLYICLNFGNFDPEKSPFMQGANERQ